LNATAGKEGTDLGKRLQSQNWNGKFFGLIGGIPRLGCPEELAKSLEKREELKAVKGRQGYEELSHCQHEKLRLTNIYRLREVTVRESG